MGHHAFSMRHQYDSIWGLCTLSELVCGLQIIYQDDYSGMCTYHAEFQIDRGMNYDAAVKVLEQEVRHSYA